MAGRPGDGRALGHAEPKAFVWRDGALLECPTEGLVPGDLIQLRAGSRVAADATLVEAADLAWTSP